MVNLTDSMPPKNHNNPPSDVEWLGENLTLRNVHAIRAAEGHIEMAERIPDHFTAENEAVFTTDLIKLIDNMMKHLENRRAEEKEPFLRQGQFVDSFFGDLKAKLKKAREKADAPLSDWLQRKARAEKEERERMARDIREQQEAALAAAVKAQGEGRAEAVDKAVTLTQTAKVADSLAAAPITSMAKTVASSGVKSGLATKWVGTVKDVEQLDLAKLRPFIAAAELQKALDRFVKQGGRVCDGAEIRETVEVKVK